MGFLYYYQYSTTELRHSHLQSTQTILEVVPDRYKAEEVEDRQVWIIKLIIGLIK